jgi:hypothetical protein
LRWRPYLHPAAALLDTVVRSSCAGGAVGTEIGKIGPEALMKAPEYAEAI